MNSRCYGITNCFAWRSIDNLKVKHRLARNFFNFMMQRGEEVDLIFLRSYFRLKKNKLKETTYSLKNKEKRVLLFSQH